MAQNLLACLQTLGWQTDLITNVPLGKSRLKERGYNQVTVIARPLAMAMNLPLATQAIVRERETRSQVGLSAQERLTNVAGAFRALPNIVSGKSVLLVDDVATTGATLNACAAALRTAGAVRVYALTLARALRIEDHSAEVNPSTQTGV
jgi:ComF family protein